jgi:hypothetical protein
VYHRLLFGIERLENPMQRFARAALAIAVGLAPATVARADGLAGSPSSMAHQHEIAVKEDYTFLRTSKDVRTLATKGALVPVTENADLALSKVSYPFARPEVRDFVERFAQHYREATGARLVVTSLIRPTTAQPANAHKLSVHPAGMAVDFRVPATSTDRAFLESSLLAMEKAGVLDVTRERSPAHYHVAVFADAYARYAARQDSIEAVAADIRARAEALARSAKTAAAAAVAPGDEGSHTGLLAGLTLLVALTGPVMFRASRTRAARARGVRA